MSPIRHECGVIGVTGPGASSRAVMGLRGLQHRGQESAGAASFDGAIHVHKAMGLVDQVFDGTEDLPGTLAVAHNRYSTAGASTPVNAGPFQQETPLGPIALAHNGNVVNSQSLRELIRPYDLTPVSTSDSELLALMLRIAPGKTWFERIEWMASKVNGSYSLTILTPDGIIAVRDPMGNRPLVLGRIIQEGGTGWAVASESAAFPLLGAKAVRDIDAGEVIKISVDGITILGQITGARRAFCAFEHIYIARPDSVFGTRTVHEIRQAIGSELADEHGVPADMVVAVPDSGTSAALGYAARSGVVFGEGLIKNRYVGRTFIQPTQAERERLIRLKFGVLPLRGKRLVLVDDSIVRGNTLRPLVGLLFEAGASEIHVRIASPRIFRPCYLGVDMASEDELIANRLDEDGMARWVGATSLRHVSIDGLLRAIRGLRSDTCLACFNGEYPMLLPGDHSERESLVELVVA